MATASPMSFTFQNNDLQVLCNALKRIHGSALIRLCLCKWYNGGLLKLLPRRSTRQQPSSHLSCRIFSWGEGEGAKDNGGEMERKRRKQHKKMLTFKAKVCIKPVLIKSFSKLWFKIISDFSSRLNWQLCPCLDTWTWIFISTVTTCHQEFFLSPVPHDIS